MRALPTPPLKVGTEKFPFLFGGTFIEGRHEKKNPPAGDSNFPSFSEGLSLRGKKQCHLPQGDTAFPFLFGGTFIEGRVNALAGTGKTYNFPSFSEGLSLRDQIARMGRAFNTRFPFLFGGTFIEGRSTSRATCIHVHISLPFRRDFH